MKQSKTSSGFYTEDDPFFPLRYDSHQRNKESVHVSSKPQEAWVQTKPIK